MLHALSCEYTADYSTVTGERILPFVFTLNLEDSILYPEEGEHQTFCYDIQGVGENTSDYADLSHFLFGICQGITLDDLYAVSVVIDEVPQTVVLGENVQIKTIDDQDHSTGCIGLKFDFPLNKVDGNMQVCYSLLTPWTVGDVNICLFGGRTTATGLTICGPSCGGGGESCSSTFYNKETVCVPVTVTPYAEPGNAKATCCGTPTVAMGRTCSGNNKSCTFTITQALCIEIPIAFGAEIETGTAVVSCGSTVTETPCNCAEPEIVVEELKDKTKSAENNRRFLGR